MQEIYIPVLKGSVEKFRELVSEAVSSTYFHGKDYGPWSILATFSDHVLVRVCCDKETGNLITSYDDDDRPGGVDRDRSKQVKKIWKITFTAGDNEEIELGEPTEVEFTVKELEESLIAEGGLPEMTMVLDEGVDPSVFHLAKNTFYSTVTNRIEESNSQKEEKRSRISKSLSSILRKSK